MKTTVLNTALQRLVAASALFLAATHGSKADAADARGAPSDLSKPIAVSDNGRFLKQSNGQPFFYLGENAEYLLWRLGREDTEIYLRDRSRKGFSVIMSLVVPRFDLNIPNAYGHQAFVGGDLTRPNPKYFEHIDWVAERAAHYGLRMGLMPINGTYVARGVFNLKNVDSYGRWIGERYRGKGVIWILGHDTTPIWTPDSLNSPDLVLKDFRHVYDRMASSMIAISGKETFITYHPPCCNFPGTAEPRTSLYWSNREWLDMNMLQSSHFSDPSSFLKQTGLAFGWTATRGYEPIRLEYDSLPTRPVVDGEAHWEHTPRNGDEKEMAGRWDEVDIRNSAYQSVFAGAAGHSYGHVSVYAFVDGAIQNPGGGFFQFARVPWKEALDAPGAAQIGYVKSLVLSRPYFTRIPDQSVVIGDAGDGSAHITATRDRTGNYIMIYLPLGQSISVDLRKLSGLSANAWWYDPRTGTSKRVEGSFSTNELQRFQPPSSGRGNDWVLVLDDASQGFAAPGVSDHVISRARR